MIEYPKALYKDGVGAQFEQLPCVTVNSREEEAAKNAEGWYQIGAAPVVETTEPAQETSADDLATLRDALAAKGVSVDGRWGAARLREELAKVA